MTSHVQFYVNLTKGVSRQICEIYAKNFSIYLFVQLDKLLRIFHLFAEKPPCADLHEILHEESSSRCNQRCQILSQSDKEF